MLATLFKSPLYKGGIRFFVKGGYEGLLSCFNNILDPAIKSQDDDQDVSQNVFLEQRRAHMKKILIIVILFITLPLVSFAASIEQEKMMESIKHEEEEQQKQREQQAVQPVFIIVPTGYFAYPAGGYYHPDNRPHPKPHPGGKPNPKPCPVAK